MGLFLSRVSPGRRIFCLFAGFFVRSESPFLRPDPQFAKPARAGAVKVGRRPNLAAYSALARPHLDSFEHDGTLAAVGMTIRGEPAFGRGSIAPRPCIRWVQDPNHDALMRIGGEAPRRRTHSFFRRKPRGAIGTPPPRTVIGNRSQLNGPGRNCRCLQATTSISLRRAQNDAVRHYALSHEPPQSDQKLARQGHDHDLASPAGVLGAGSKPLCQGAVLLEHEKSPR